MMWHQEADAFDPYHGRDRDGTNQANYFVLIDSIFAFVPDKPTEVKSNHIMVTDNTVKPFIE